ncbi:DNA alkylation repair protein [Patescibacteria group bacterium]|nr:DNA alkylation repair protein [Patescibacteria group bacterium]MCL5409399.1 DNA alkylation repair protein [Patescibacteria group bacterium]
MANLQREILKDIQKVSQSNHCSARDLEFNLGKYLGTTHQLYRLSNPQQRQIAKDWAKKLKTQQAAEVVDLLSSLYQSCSYEEKTLPSFLLEYLPQLRVVLDPSILDQWLETLEGWAEIDTLCAGPWSAQDFLEQWGKWEKLLQNLVKDKNPVKQRASLVLLVKPVRQSVDPKLANIAFVNIEKLKSSQDILITKAVSWLLRSLITQHKQTVKEYLAKNADSLPKVALRETQRKLLTGRK